MLNSGDVVDLELGVPEGQEAGFAHPCVLITAQRILDQQPNVVHVVPLTSTIRGFQVEAEIDPDAANGIAHRSAAQCQHLRAVTPARIIRNRGNVGPTTLASIRETIALILDLP